MTYGSESECATHNTTVPLTMGDVAIISGNFVILKNKRSNVEFASKVDLHPLIQY